MFLGLVFGLLLTASSVFTSESTKSPLYDKGKIVGGFPIDISEVPYQISLRLSGSHICGGSILAPRMVLTAAHCTISFEANQLSVKAGSNSSMEYGTNIYDIIKKEEHPKYNPSTSDYDFSVLTLASKIKFNHEMKPIALPRTINKRYDDGEMALVSGWGALEETEQTASEYLSAAYVPIINQPKCQILYPSDKITARMICAGYVEGGIDSCQGDSGGGLADFNAKTLIGVTSYGEGCARENKPGVYAKVASVLPWVRRKMSKINSLKDK